MITEMRGETIAMDQSSVPVFHHWKHLHYYTGIWEGKEGIRQKGRMRRGRVFQEECRQPAYIGGL
jgi:hypothetical protein